MFRERPRKETPLSAERISLIPAWPSPLEAISTSSGTDTRPARRYTRIPPQAIEGDNTERRFGHPMSQGWPGRSGSSRHRLAVVRPYMTPATQETKRSTRARISLRSSRPSDLRVSSAVCEGRRRSGRSWGPPPVRRLQMDLERRRGREGNDRPVDLSGREAQRPSRHLTDASPSIGSPSGDSAIRTPRALNSVWWPSR
jgi:hypothetical protein